MKKVLWLLPPILALPLLLTSTVSCGCEPNPFSIAGQMEIFPMDGQSPLPPEKNQTLGSKTLVGRPISKLPLNDLPLDSQCKFVSPTELQCEYWNEIGFLFSLGRHVTIQGDSSGKVTSVSVASIFGVGSRAPQT